MERVIKVIIGEDDRKFAEAVRKRTESYFRKRELPVEIKVMEDGEYLRDETEKGRHGDIYILDVRMPFLTGLEICALLRKLKVDCGIILLTAWEEYALEGYRYDVKRYVLKEKLDEEFSEALDAVLEDREVPERRHYTIDNTRRKRKIYHDEIVYIKKNEKDSVFYLSDGDTVSERKAISDVFSDLDDDDFVFINRSQIVNLRHIKAIRPREAVTGTGMKLEMSEKRSRQLKNNYMEYIRRRSL